RFDVSRSFRRTADIYRRMAGAKGPNRFAKSSRERRELSRDDRDGLATTGPSPAPWPQSTPRQAAWSAGAVSCGFHTQRFLPSRGSKSVPAKDAPSRIRRSNPRPPPGSKQTQSRLTPPAKRQSAHRAQCPCPSRALTKLFSRRPSQTRFGRPQCLLKSKRTAPRTLLPSTCWRGLLTLVGKIQIAVGRRSETRNRPLP